MPPCLRIGLFAVCGSVIGTTLGCGSGKDVYPVRGTVLVDGRPAERVVVTFHPASGGPRSMATTAADGSFLVSTHGPNNGVAPGEYAVTIVWPEYTPDGEPGADRLKGRFASVVKPFTRLTISDRSVRLDPFEISQ